MRSDIEPQDEHVIDEWPADGLERLENCPICGSADRHRLYKDLTDRVFRCAPGRWDLYECEGCRCAYLDPRPTPSTIGLAYATYFTHTTNSQEEFEQLSWLHRLRRVFANGYRNNRFGTKLQPASRLGVVAAKILPNQRRVIDAEFRHISRATPGMRLLDVGCGNGGFLIFARSAGWDVVGLDLDPKAVKAARSQGLDVRGGNLDVIDPDRDSFDGITLGHVIEHVHDPISVLRQCHALLKPCGWIWLDTPNVEAQGHRRYGSTWRDLDPPRHLVLFNRESLFLALENAGFQAIEDQPYRPLCAGIFAASEAIAKGEDPWEAMRLSRQNPWEAMRLWQQTGPAVRMGERAAKREPTLREFITVKASKNKGSTPKKGGQGIGVFP